MYTKDKRSNRKNVNSKWNLEDSLPSDHDSFKEFNANESARVILTSKVKISKLQRHVAQTRVPLLIRTDEHTGRERRHTEQKLTNRVSRKCKIRRYWWHVSPCTVYWKSVNSFSFSRFSGFDALSFNANWANCRQLGQMTDWCRAKRSVKQGLDRSTEFTGDDLRVRPWCWQ